MKPMQFYFKNILINKLQKMDYVTRGKGFCREKQIVIQDASKQTTKTAVSSAILLRWSGSKMAIFEAITYPGLRIFISDECTSFLNIIVTSQNMRYCMIIVGSIIF